MSLCALAKEVPPPKTNEKGPRVDSREGANGGHHVQILLDKRLGRESEVSPRFENPLPGFSVQ